MLHTVVIQFVDQKVSYVYSEDFLLMQIIDIINAAPCKHKMAFVGELIYQSVSA